MKKPTPFGKYYLLERISVGGMAEVFRAKAFGVEGFERMVAVKRILPSIAEDREFIRMFIEEAKLSVQLNHANVAQIFDLGVFDGSYYIALEHVHGRDLRAMFERCRQLGEAMPIAQACFIAMKVCEGLDYAHHKRDQAGRELSLVHRDVSPQNILVSFEGEVKLIDFGLAKAAGAAPTSQTAIFKGKFGYMSPEQAGGQDIDRRSDVFSCGVVLHELLTGERLFVGETDWATLEKVRKAEILPPSTYSRKIPGELDRIVLKALSCDPLDRYQSAIDLHDELQAFVYAAGEFYARKDLAAWMKRVFGQEIEEETARLDSYRQLKPPPATAGAPPEVVRAQPSGKVPPPRPTQPVAAARPPAASRPVPSPALPPRSVPVAAIPPAPVAEAAPTVLLPGKPSRAQRPAEDWDEELETRVYDGDDPRHRSHRSSLPLQPPVSSSPGIPLPAGPGSVRHAAGGPRWADDGGTDAYPEASPPIPGSGAHPGEVAAPAILPGGPDDLAPPSSTSGPVGPSGAYAPPGPYGDAGAMSGRRELSAPHRGVAPTFTSATSADLPTIPVTAFGARITAGRRARKRPGWLAIAVGGGALVVIVAAVVIALPGAGKPIAEPPPPRVVPAPPPPVTADPGTGFDLYVTPAGITQWKLDGESRTDRLPSRIRGISPGPHTVQIEPPPGFLSQTQRVAVELGKAPRVDIVLQPISGISGVFESTPPGATVSLIVDGKRQPVGSSPARAPLDPRSTYQVLFEKPGYVSVNRPIVLSGALEERVAVNLEKVAAPAPLPPPEPRPRRVNRPGPEKRPAEKPAPASATEPAPADERPAPEDSAAEPRPGDAPRSRAQGVLILGSKPPCDIAIDGAATGLHTPQKELKLPVGRHRVTLTNSEFGINETFTVDIQAATPEKLIKDYSDRLPN